MEDFRIVEAIQIRCQEVSKGWHSSDRKKY